VVVLKDDGESAEEEVEDAEEDGTEETEQQDHRLEEEELEGAETAPGDGADKRLLVNLDWSFPVLLAGFFAESDRFLLEFDGMVSFGDEERDENELDSRPDKEYPERPSANVSIYEFLLHYDRTKV